MPIQFHPNDALFIVDAQIDFFPNGALSVPNGDVIIPVINAYLAAAQKAQIPIFASRDWHPSNHISFKAQGGPWPPHCVQNTKGAEFHPDLHLPTDLILVSKGTNPQQDAYSGFEGITEQEHIPTTQKLQQLQVKRLWIMGLALDYCVAATALGARKAGFAVKVLLPGCRGIDPTTIAQAMAEMQAAGVEFE